MLTRASDSEAGMRKRAQAIKAAGGLDPALANGSLPNWSRRRCRKRSCSG
jgi:hypothetical protein